LNLFLSINIDTTVQKFGVGKICKVASCAHKGCIYYIKIQFCEYCEILQFKITAFYLNIWNLFL